MYSDMMETLQEEFGDNPEEVRSCLPSCYSHHFVNVDLYVPLSINTFHEGARVFTWE